MKTEDVKDKISRNSLVRVLQGLPSEEPNLDSILRERGIGDKEIIDGVQEIVKYAPRVKSYLEDYLELIKKAPNREYIKGLNEVSLDVAKNSPRSMKSYVDLIANDEDKESLGLSLLGIHSTSQITPKYIGKTIDFFSGLDKEVKKNAVLGHGYTLKTSKESIGDYMKLISGIDDNLAKNVFSKCTTLCENKAQLDYFLENSINDLEYINENINAMKVVTKTKREEKDKLRFIGEIVKAMTMTSPLMKELKKKTISADIVMYTQSKFLDLMIETMDSSYHI